VRGEKRRGRDGARDEDTGDIQAGGKGQSREPQIASLIGSLHGAG
jgi:hypothetical protein